MKLLFSLFCLLVLNITAGCNHQKYVRFQPILEYYPSTMHENKYIILPPSTCYSCQSEFMALSSWLLLKDNKTKCIFCTEKYGYEALNEKCIQSGLKDTNLKIDTLLFNHLELQESELGYPILLEVVGNKISGVTICTNSEILINRLNEINP